VISQPSPILHKNEIASLVVLASTLWCAAFFSFCDDTTSGVCELMSVITVTTNLVFLLFNVAVFFCFFAKRNHLNEKFQKKIDLLKRKRLTGRGSRSESMVQEEVDVENGGGGGVSQSGGVSRNGGEEKNVMNPYFSVEMSTISRSTTEGTTKNRVVRRGVEEG
jgi:hypothetical protein